MTKVAVVQTSPVLLDRDQTVQLAATLIDEAAGQGAELVVFTETFIPGYPVWMWRLRPGGDWGITEKIHSRLLENSVSLERGDLSPLYQAASISSRQA